MHLLLASILPLVLGPALVWVLQRARWAARALDAFVLVSIAGLVLLNILPEALADAGLPAVIAIVLGIGLPMLGSKVFAAKPSAARSATVMFGLLGLALHATLDGVALSTHAQGHAEGHGSTLALAVLLHRFPVGLAIWWLVRPRLGVRVALASVAAISASSALGFFWAHTAHDWMHGQALGMFQALVAGSLLHVAVGHSVAPEKPDNHGRWQLASASGGLFGVATVAFLAQSHPLHRAFPDALGFGQTFLNLASRSAPALLLAFATASLLHFFLPKQLGSWLRGGTSLSQAFRGVSAGVPNTTCACNINPRYESLVRGGIPPSAAIAFLVATPELGIVSVAVSFALLGPQLGTARIAAALILAITVGLVLGKALTIVRGTRIPPGPEPERAPDWPVRLRRALHYGFVDVPDRTLPWFVAGLLAASLVEPMLSPAYIGQLPSWLDVPLFAVLGMPLYVCAAGATPLATLMIHKGLSAGAAIAFLLTGPAMNLTTFGLLTQLHGRRVAVLFSVVMGASAIGLGFIVNAALPGMSIDLHNLTPEEPVATYSMAAVGLVLVSSWLRQGAHGFVSRVVQLHGHHHHGSPHDPHTPEAPGAKEPAAQRDTGS